MTVHVVIPHRPGDRQRARNTATVQSWWLHTFGLGTNVCDDPNPTGFNRGRALNAGVADLGADPFDVLVLTDGDLIPDQRAIEQAIGAVAAGSARGYVVPFTEVRYLSAGATEAVHAGDAPTDHELDGVWDRRSTGGINVMRVATFEAAAGFDPRFTGWGFEDSAWDIAVSTLVAPTRWMAGPVWHLWHPPARDPEHPSYQAGLDLCRRYEDAYGDVAAVRALIDERAAE